MRHILILTVSSLLLSVTGASAQEDKSDEKEYNRGWYIGTQAGMPMAEADFSPFCVHVNGSSLFSVNRINERYQSCF